MVIRRSSISKYCEIAFEPLPSPALRRRKYATDVSALVLYFTYDVQYITRVHFVEKLLCLLRCVIATYIPAAVVGNLIGRSVRHVVVAAAIVES